MVSSSTAKEKRVRRELPDSVKATVEIAIITEHLLYKNYCDTYSSTPSCAEGTDALTDYVETIVYGVKYVHQFDFDWFFYELTQKYLWSTYNPKQDTIILGINKGLTLPS